MDFFRKNTLFYEYNSETKSYIVKGGKIKKSVLKIPAFYNDGKNGEHPVTEVADFAFYGIANEGMRRVYYLFLPDTLTKIGGYAFAHSSISNFILPPNVTDLEIGVCANCKVLSKVKLNNKITFIPRFMFQNCDLIGSIDIPENVTSIGDNAFSGANSLKEITIPKNCKTLGDSVFPECSSLHTVNNLENVDEIGESCFAWCEKLVNIKLSGNLKDIKTRTFYMCEKIKEISLPYTINSIHPSAFEGASEAAVKEYHKWKDFNQFKSYVTDDMLELKNKK